MRLGKQSAKLTEGVPAYNNILIRCEPYSGIRISSINKATDSPHPFRPCGPLSPKGTAFVKASPWGKLSAQLTEGVPAHINVIYIDVNQNKKGLPFDMSTPYNEIKARFSLPRKPPNLLSCGLSAGIRLSAACPSGRQPGLYTNCPCIGTRKSRERRMPYGNAAHQRHHDSQDQG